ncbi:hypothetical protein HS048_08665 [Planomonospora sp. ID91781]|uniref:hypothetical protein n=1 Tax=Planomonospora sp. ID91781 TaxID=2738135 RepID=UPI0018C3D816|nr:hypothetical protein [Planomonospora sp. ID91781]MBG0820804.1 hypothetical protein [Planomonospora sp. ID91781]
MNFQRSAGLFIGATSTFIAILGAAPVTATADPATTARAECTYQVQRVRTFLSVRERPTVNSREIDRLFPGDYTVGRCKNYNGWRYVEGSRYGLNGYSANYYLKLVIQR